MQILAELRVWAGQGGVAKGGEHEHHHACHDHAAATTTAVLGLAEEDDVSPVQKGQEAVAQDERGFVDVQEVEQVQHAAPEAEVPEVPGHHEFLLLLALQPLEDEAAAENGSSQKAHRGPHRGVNVEPVAEGGVEVGLKKSVGHALKIRN